MVLLAILLALYSGSLTAAQEAASPDPKQRARAARELGRQSSTVMPRLEALLADPVLDVRLEAVKAIVNIGTQHSLAPLVAATRDADPEIQVRATDGLVNFFLPGYLQTGLSASVRRIGTSIKGRFTDTNDQAIDPFIQVRAEIVEALGKLVRGASSLEARANAARAAGILRARAAVPDLLEALRTKDDQVIYEVLIAVQKIRDPAAGPEIAFLLRDLNEKIQIAALETTGILGNHGALPQLREALERARTPRIRRTALAAIAMLPDPANLPTYVRFLQDQDADLRAAAAEGYARLKDPVHASKIRQAFADERKMSPRLSLAFALVSLGSREISELSPLQYLVNTLNSKAWRGVAQPFLVELAREAPVRAQLYTVLPRANREEKTGLVFVLSRSGDQDTLAYLEPLSRDADPEVAQEATRALRVLQARLSP